MRPGNVAARLRHDDRGSVAVTVVLFPLFIVITFAFVQTLLWQRDRDIADAAADRASTAVALYGGDVGGAQAELEGRLRAVGLEHVSVTIDRSDDETVVDVAGDAPGILVGTSARIHARSVTPTDRY